MRAIYTIKSFVPRSLVLSCATLFFLQSFLLGQDAVPETGLRLWLKADSGVILNGERVKKWLDRSGNGADAIQLSPARQPAFVGNAVNGKPAIAFDGAGDYMTFRLPLNGLTRLTLVLVCSTPLDTDGSWNGVRNAPLFWGETAPWGTVHLSPFAGIVRYRFGTGQAQNLPSVKLRNPAANRYRIVVAMKNRNREYLYVDGAQVLTQHGKLTTIQNVDDLGNLGRGYGNTFFRGEIAEVLVYAKTLTRDERKQLMGYLSAKYFGDPPAATPLNQAPSVSAGGDQTVTFPESVVLEGSATDDGLPSGRLDLAWTKVSGPGAVTFAPPNQASTSASFSAPGTYVLRLTATDGELTATDDVQVLVRDTATASAPDAAVPRAGLKVWFAADQGVVASGTKVARWTDLSGSGADATQTAAASQPVLVDGALNGKPVVRFDGVNDFLTFPYSPNGLTAMTIVLVSAAAQDYDGTWNGVRNAPLFWNETGGWGTVHLSPFQRVVRFRFGTGQRANLPSYRLEDGPGMKYRSVIAVKNGPTESLFVDGKKVLTLGGKLSTIQRVRTQGNLGRGYNDDSFFAGDIAEVLVYQRALTDAEISQVSQYLQAKYSSGGAQTPEAAPNESAPPPANQAPVVSAGADFTVNLPGPATLQGSAADDGLPSGSMTYQWTQVSGPAPAALINPTSLTAQAHFTAAGQYVFRFTANDGDLSDSDEVAVTVQSAPSASSVGFEQVSFNEFVPQVDGVINVKTMCGAKGDGVTDDTAALRNCIENNLGAGYSRRYSVLYFPKGTYLIRDTLRFRDSQGKCRAYLAVAGESRSETVIRLKDRAPGFGDPGRPKAVLWLANEQVPGYAADAECAIGQSGFGNDIWNLTIDTGSGNPGAVGIDYVGHNGVGIYGVTVKSADRRGKYGIGAYRRRPYGPVLATFSYIRVEGFDYGVFLDDSCCSLTMEHIELQEQNKYGIYNRAQAVSIRKLWSRNTVPAVYAESGLSQIVLLDSRLDGGSAGSSAIVNNHENGSLFVRNVTVSGYGHSIRDAGSTVDGDIVEWSSDGPFQLFASSKKSLKLPVAETPVYTNRTPSDWANVRDFGARPDDYRDDAAAIQAAIDSGKPVIYFPRGQYNIGRTVYLRGAVRKLTGFGAQIIPHDASMTSASKPAFLITNELNGPDITIERLCFSPNYTSNGTLRFGRVFYNRSDADVVLRYLKSGTSYANQAGVAGRLFVESVCCGLFRIDDQQAYLRGFNPEGSKQHLLVTGAQARTWLLGGKSERFRQGTPLFEARAGAKLEVLGFLFAGGAGHDPTGTPLIRDVEADVSGTFCTYYSTPPDFTLIVQETKGGVTKQQGRSGLPRRGPWVHVPLWVGW